MGCGACNSRKALMHMVSSYENEFSKGASLFSSQGVNPSYLSLSNLIDNSHIPNVPVQEIKNDTERSGLSEDVVSASKEFKKFFVRPLENMQSLLQKEFKIFVWTKNRKLLRDTFPERTITEVLETAGISCEVNFIVFSSKAPIIIDCVVYLVEKIDDFKEVYRINQQYKHVCVQALLTSVDHKNMEEIAKTLGIHLVKSVKQLFNKIFLEDYKLVSMLNDLFHRIDQNSRGEIDFSELFYLVQQIRPDITPDEIRDGLKRIDIHQKGRINFDEFCFWWKKGRQGPVTFTESIVNWAKIVAKNPETKTMLRTMTQNRLMVNKESRKKEIEIQIGNCIGNETDLMLEIGKGMFRERLLKDVNKEFSMYSQEIWMSFRIKVRPHKGIQNVEEFIKRKFHNLLDALTSDYIDGKRIKKSLNVNTVLSGTYLNLIIILDTSDDYMEPLNKLLLELDDLLSYPTDDNLTINLKSSESFYKLFSPLNVLQVIGNNTKIEFSSENWSKILSICMSRFPDLLKVHPILSLYLISKGKSSISFKNCSEFFQTCQSLFKTIPKLNNLLTYPIQDFMVQVKELIEDDIQIHSRCGSLGLKLNLYSSNLVHNILING